MSDVLKSRNALLFVAISLVSGFGGGVMSLASALWVWDLSGSTSLAALVGLCVFLPSLGGPAIGAVVDRWPRRPVLIGTNLVLAAMMTSLWWVGSAKQLGLIFLVMLGCGTGYVLLDAGESALLPACIPAARLAVVNGWRMSAQEGTKLISRWPVPVCMRGRVAGRSPWWRSAPWLPRPDSMHSSGHYGPRPQRRTTAGCGPAWLSCGALPTCSGWLPPRQWPCRCQVCPPPRFMTWSNVTCGCRRVSSVC